MRRAFCGGWPTFLLNRRARRRTCALVFVALTVVGAMATQAGLIDKEQRLRAGKAALQDGLFEIAAKEFAAYVKAAATNHERAQGVLYWARALYWQGRFCEAAELLRERESWAKGTEFEPSFLLLRGRSLFEAGALPEAIACVEQFERDFPEHPSRAEMLRLHAKCAVRLKQHEAALQLFERFEEQYADSMEMPDNLLDHAAVLLEREDTERAVAVLERLVKTYPLTEAGLRGSLWLGRLRLRLGQFEAARAIFAETMSRKGVGAEWRAQAAYLWADTESTGTNIAAVLQVLDEALKATRSKELAYRIRALRGQLLTRVGQAEEGIREVREAARSLPAQEAEAAQLALATTLLQAKDYDRAAREFQVYLDSFTNVIGVARALSGKGWSLLELGRYAEAAAAFDSAAALWTDPERRAEAWMKAGDALFAAGQYRAARTRYERVIRDAPQSAFIQTAQLQIAETMARLNETAPAIEAFEALVRMYPTSPMAAEALMRVAAVKESEARWEDALADYERALTATTNLVIRTQARHRMGLIRYRLGRFQEALSDFEQVIGDQPTSEWAEQAFYMRGWCLYLLGQPEEAFRTCQEFLTQYPQSRWSADVQFWLGEYAYNRGDYADAERQFVDIATRYPQSETAADAQYWAGRAAVAQREFVRAIEHFTALARNYPDSPRLIEARFAQGDALSELGQFDVAILAFEEVIKLAPNADWAASAWGRKGDCLFILAAENPARYQEAQAAYRMVLDHPRATRDAKLQAEYKIGRCREKLGQLEEAFERYMNVVYAWLADAEKGKAGDPIWFTRAAFNAAELRESQEKWAEAEGIYRRVASAGVAASAEAASRAKKMEEWRSTRNERTQP